MTRPGNRLRAFARVLCPPQAMARFIDPAIADVQHEHAEALRERRRWRARWIAAAGSLRVLQLIGSVAVDVGSWSGVLAASIGVVALVTWTLTALVLNGLPAELATDRIYLGLLLIPSSLPVAVPCGMAVAAVWRSPDRTGLRPVGIAALVLSVAMLAMVAWVTPAANQAFREAVVGHPVLRGFNELTLPQLGRLLVASPSEIDRVPEWWSLVAPHNTRAAAFAFHGRLAIACSPLAAALLAFAASERGRGGRAAIVMLAWLAYVTAHVLVRTPLSTFSALSPALVAWLPNLTVAAMALLPWTTRTSRTVRTT